LRGEIRGLRFKGMSNRPALNQNERQRRWLKIGEVSKQSGVGVEALRFYERLGLLGQPRRTASGYRLYDEGVMDRLTFIKRAQVLGFTLTEIGRLIAEKDAGQSPCPEVREIVRRRLKELDERLEEMRSYRDELASALEEWDEAGDVEGHVCGLIEGTAVKHSPPAGRLKGKAKR
jgi:DNA-binding transcriptional MerR regulator